MVKIRLARKGNRKRPFYRVVVAEEASRRDGRFIEIVGTYDPLTKPATVEVQSDAILKWLSQGAQPTDTVKRILMKSGVWAHWRAVQRGEAELGSMEGPVAGTVERGRDARPSKKAAAKIADEQENEGAEAEPSGESSGEASGDETSDAAAGKTADGA